MKKSNKTTTGIFETAQQRAQAQKQAIETAQAQQRAQAQKQADYMETLHGAQFPKRSTIWDTDEKQNFIITETLKATWHTTRYILSVSSNPNLIPIVWGLQAISRQKARFIDDLKTGNFTATRGIITQAQRAQAQRDACNNIIIPDVASECMDLWHTALEAYMRELEKNTGNEFKQACKAIRAEIYANGDRGRVRVKTNCPITIETKITHANGTTETRTETQAQYTYTARYKTVAIENYTNANGDTLENANIDTATGKRPLYISPSELPENKELHTAQAQAIKDIKKALTKTQLQIFLAMQDLTKTRTKSRTMDNKQIAKTAKVVNSNCSEKELLAGAEKVRYNRNIVNNKARSIIQSDIKELFTFYISGENNNKNNNVYAPVKITPIKIPTDYTPNNSNIKLAPTTYTTLYRNEQPTEQLPTINYTLELLPFIESNVINIPKNYKSMNERKKA